MYRLVIESSQNYDNHINLTSEQEHYLRRVLRLKVGAEFMAIDGGGNCWLVELTATGGRIIKTVSNDTELPIFLSLMIALPKGNGFDEIVRCGTELGVNQFIPVISERTLLRPKENKVIRWRKIAIEAAEQSERLILPDICEPMPFKQALSHIDGLQTNRYIAIARGDNPTLAKTIRNNEQFLNDSILIATGPEGGWTNSEIEMAIVNNFQPVSLGKRILRAITAPIMAASIIVGIYD